jgi:hypothetical protein
MEREVILRSTAGKDMKDIEYFHDSDTEKIGAVFA